VVRVIQSPSVQTVVVETLQYEGDVGKAKVDGKCYDERKERAPQSTGEVCNVTQRPDEQERDGDAGGRSVTVVFEDLGYL